MTPNIYFILACLMGMSPRAAGIAAPRPGGRWSRGRGSAVGPCGAGRYGRCRGGGRLWEPRAVIAAGSLAANGAPVEAVLPEARSPSSSRGGRGRGRAPRKPLGTAC